jgi:hypothetical protein
MNTQHHGKRTTSARLERLDDLERVIREFGLKDRSHFFQLCTDALIQAHGKGARLDWPPHFAVVGEQTKNPGAEVSA